MLDIRKCSAISVMHRYFTEDTLVAVSWTENYVFPSFLKSSIFYTSPGQHLLWFVKKCVKKREKRTIWIYKHSKLAEKWCSCSFCCVLVMTLQRCRYHGSLSALVHNLFIVPADDHQCSAAEQISREVMSSACLCDRWTLVLTCPPHVNDRHRLPHGPFRNRGWIKTHFHGLNDVIIRVLPKLHIISEYWLVILFFLSLKAPDICRSTCVCTCTCV